MPDTALLLIDVQTALFEVAPPMHRRDELLDTLADLLQRARAANIGRVFLQHHGPPGHLVDPRTPGWELHPRLAPTPEELVVAKREPDGFMGTALHPALESLGVRRLLIAGLATEGCIDSTCRRAYAHGYETWLAADGHSTWNSELLPASTIIAHHNQVLTRFARVRPAAELPLG